MNKKIMVIGLVSIFFLISTVGVPAINTNVEIESKNKIIDKGLVEVTVSICKIDEIEDQTMFLTQQQIDHLDNIFNELKNELKNADTEEETISTYNEAIELLDQYGFLPDGLSVEEAKQLVTTINDQYPNLMHVSAGQDNNENLNCFIAGVTSNSRIGVYPLSGFGLCTVMGFGFSEFNQLIPPYHFYYPAQGGVYTFGLNGNINWEGEFYGQYFHFYDFLALFRYGCGGVGFTGIKFWVYRLDNLFGYFFIGTALKVKLGPNYPPTNIENRAVQNNQNLNQQILMHEGTNIKENSNVGSATVFSSSRNIHVSNPMFLNLLQRFSILSQLFGL